MMHVNMTVAWRRLYTENVSDKGAQVLRHTLDSQGVRQADKIPLLLALQHTRHNADSRQRLQ